MLSWLGGSTDVDMVFGLPAGTATARVRENWSLARIHPAPILSFEDKPVKPQEHQLLPAFCRLWPMPAPLVGRGGAAGGNCAAAKRARRWPTREKPSASRPAQPNKASLRLPNQAHGADVASGI